MNRFMTGVAAAALLAATSAFAADDMTNKGTAGGASNSGPGVQGPPDTRTGPSTKGSAEQNDSGASGTSTGAAGSDMGKQTGPNAGKTDPSQDASGVAGAPGNKNGPAAKDPSSGSTGAGSTGGSAQ